MSWMNELPKKFMDNSGHPTLKNLITDLRSSLRLLNKSNNTMLEATLGLKESTTSLIWLSRSSKRTDLCSLKIVQPPATWRLNPNSSSLPSLPAMNGITTEWCPQSKTKELVDHAGLSPPSELWSPTGTFWEKERTWPSLNSNLLTVLEISTITAAMEVFLPMLSNISDMLAVLS